MKFAKHLETESVAEWRRAYINYKGLKRKLDVIEKHRQTSDLAAKAQKEQQKQRNGTSTTLHDGPVNLEPTTNPSPPQLQRYISWRLRRSNTLTSSHNNGVQQQQQAKQLPSNRKFVDRLSRPFSRGDAELGQVYSPPISLDVNGLDELLPLTNEPERNFLVMLDQELEKISRFYNEKEQESQEKFDSLKMQLELVEQYRQQRTRRKRTQDDTLEQRLNPIRWFHSQKPLNATAPSSATILSATVIDEGEHHMSYKVARSRLKAAIPEFYRSLELLRSYKILNETGFQKILKKFDKTARWKASTIYDKKLKMYHWVKSDVVDNIIQETERFFVNEFTNGHRRRGMKKLRIPENHGDYATATWRIGFCLGACIAIFARVIQLALDPTTQEQLPLLAYNMNIYSCVILPILFTLGFSVNMVVWHRSHINYRFIFELNPRTCLNYRQFAELPSFMLLLTSIVMYIDVSQCWAPAISSQICPLILVLIILAILLCPFQIFYLSARQWLGITLGRIALSGLLPVEFRDFFIADELNSLAFSLWMGIYFFCVYSWHWTDLAAHCNVPKMWVSPCLACLPPLWRGLQCLRRYYNSKEVHHLANGLKYVTSIMATIFVGVRRISPSPTVEAFWILVSIINSTYTSIWDIKMDWGLLSMDSQHYLLRDDLVFYKWTYYVAIPVNIVLRFSWAINKAGLAYNLPILTFLTALLEAMRRIMWNFYRLENEHLNNCGNYRAIKEIPLPFILTLDEIPVLPTENQGEEEQQQPRTAHPSLLVSEDLADPSLLSVNNSNRLSNLDYSTNSSRNNSRNNSRNSGNSRQSRHSAVIPITSVDQGGGTLAKPGGPIVATGSFYGRRDFETRQDKDDDGKLGLVRQSSMVGQVLDRIRTLAAPNTTDSDSGNDNEGDEDDDEEDTVASQSCASRDQTVGVCSPSTTDVWYNNTYHELTWKYNNPVFNGYETLTFHLLQQNGTDNYQQIKSFDVVHAVGVQVVLIDNTWYPSLLPDNSPNVTRIVYAYLIGSGVDLQQELDNPLSLYPRPSQFTLIQNSRNTTATSTSAAASPASSTAPASQSTPQNEQNSPALPVWAIVVIVIAAVIIIIAAIALTWLVRNIRRNRQRDHQPLNKNDTDHDEALENMAPIMGNTSTIAGSPTSNTPKSMTAISGGMMATNHTDNNSNSNHNKTNNTINKSLGPNFNHIDTNDLSSSIHSSTPMMHGSIRGSPTVPSPSSIDRPPSITTTVSSPNNAALHHLQQHDSSHQPASSILSSTDALMIADTFRQFMRKPDWSDPPAASEDLQDDHHYDDETDEQKRMRVGNELLQKQLAEEGTTMKDIERR